MNEEQIEYKNYLKDAYRKSQFNLDKNILTISSGAIGISIIFINNIIKNSYILSKDLLSGSWIFLVSTIILIIISFFTGSISFKKAFKQLNEGTIYQERPGGVWNIITNVINIFSLMFFLVGIILLLLFVRNNLGAL